MGSHVVLSTQGTLSIHEGCSAPLGALHSRVIEVLDLGSHLCVEIWLAVLLENEGERCLSLVLSVPVIGLTSVLPPKLYNKSQKGQLSLQQALEAIPEQTTPPLPWSTFWHRSITGTTWDPEADGWTLS
jgi:hypothetical protein